MRLPSSGRRASSTRLFGRACPGWSGRRSPIRASTRDLSYYAGKAAVERLVEGSGLPHAILRPACFFGPGGILIENVAWAARHLPCVPIPAGPRYRIRPIHVDDYARAVVDAVGATGTFVRDATGPDRIEFGELVDYLASLTGGRARVVRPADSCLRGALPSCLRCHARDDSHH